MQLLSVFGLLIFLAGVDGYTCPVYNPGYTTCNGFVLLMDVTNLMTSDRVDDEFVFIRNSLLPRVSYSNQHFAVNTYGASPPQRDMTNKYQDACNALNDLNDDAKRYGGQPTTLTDAIKTTLSMYDLTPPGQITIMTSTQVSYYNFMDENDIANAANYLNQFRYPTFVSIVALNGNADSFKGRNGAFKNVVPMFYPFSYMNANQQKSLADCILCMSCYDHSCTNCEQYKSATAHPTLPIPTTPRPVISPETDDGPFCTCNLQSLWIDVVVLIDNSAVSGSGGIYDLLGYVQDTFVNVNVMNSGSTQQMFTMMGIVTYNSFANVFYPLGSLDSNSLQAINSLPYSNQNATNIDSAIQLAMQQFSLYGRRNARQVIMVAAKNYFPGNYQDPQQRASVFKQRGVIAVYDYLDSSHLASSTLKSLASPGYYGSTSDIPGFNMPQALCNANCYCPSNFIGYKPDPLTGAPTAGCYQSVVSGMTFAQASQTCQQLGRGYIAMEKNLAKTTFLSRLVQPTDRYWTGFKWDNIAGTWIWNDGKRVAGSYQPWLMSSAHTQGVDCAFAQQVQGVWMWAQDVCGTSQGHTYVCERPACDSIHYCTDTI